MTCCNLHRPKVLDVLLHEHVDYKLHVMFGRWLGSRGVFKRLARALIRLRVCAGWSGPLLVAQTSLLEISCPGSCPGSNMLAIVFVMLCMYMVGEGP